jgi:hypothetical protein
MTNKTKQKQKALPSGDRSVFRTRRRVTSAREEAVFLCEPIVRESSDFVKPRPWTTEEDVAGNREHRDATGTAYDKGCLS